MLRSPGWGCGCAPLALPRAAPSAQEETQPVCVCPGLPLPRLALASQVSDLWNSENTQEISHPSACLQVRITERDPQAGRSLLGAHLSSHCPHTAWEKGRAAPQSPTQTCRWPTLTPAQLGPQSVWWCSVHILQGRLSKRHQALHVPRTCIHRLQERLEARNLDAQIPSRDQGQTVRGKQSSVDTLSRLGTKEVSWDGKGKPGPEHKWVLQNTEESLHFFYLMQMSWA